VEHLSSRRWIISRRPTSIKIPVGDVFHWDTAQIRIRLPEFQTSFRPLMFNRINTSPTIRHPAANYEYSLFWLRNSPRPCIWIHCCNCIQNWPTIKLNVFKLGVISYKFIINSSSANVHLYQYSTSMVHMRDGFVIIMISMEIDLETKTRRNKYIALCIWNHSKFTAAIGYTSNLMPQFN
jgi:hypothetical protein